MGINLVEKKVHSNGISKTYKFEIDSIGTNSSSLLLEMPIDNPKGEIHSIFCVCPTSNYFDIVIFDKYDSDMYSKNMVFYKDSNHRYLDELGIVKHFENADSPQISSLYVKITNEDDTNETGTITLAIMIKV